MQHRRAFERPIQRAFVMIFCFSLCVTPIAVLAQDAKAPADPRVHKANYDLASRWTTAKVGKLVFDTTVTPHWLETGDRFWYSYETSQGKKWWMVDPAKKAKTPMFDNAKMAAQLTSLTRIPYEAQHLPINTIKFIKNDTAFQFDANVPIDAEIPGVKKYEPPPTRGGGQSRDEQDQTQTQRSPGARPPAPRTRPIYFEYEIASGKLVLLTDFKPPQKPRWASVSPDEKTVIFARGRNLFMMDSDNYAKARVKEDDTTVVETQLTTDGEENYGYERRLTDEEKRNYRFSDKNKTPRVPAITVFWSKDSKKFAVQRNDQRKVGSLWVINSLATPRPTLETYPYGMPGEPNQPQAEIEVFEPSSKGRVKIKTDRFKDQQLGIYTAAVTNVEREKARVFQVDRGDQEQQQQQQQGPPQGGQVEPRWLGDTSDKLYFNRTSRDLKKIDVCVADTATGEVRPLIEERSNTYVEIKPLHLLSGGEMIHWSERDGWGHYYLFDSNGTMKTQLTAGEFVCSEIEGVDERTRTLYFSASGREANEDPYYAHVYSVGLNGGAIKLLDPGNATHNVTMADSNKYFVDNSSRINTAPASDLNDVLGTCILTLEQTDMTALMEAGFKYPEPFKVKADDGITDLFGVMYKPFDFDASKRYPIIAFVYPGPQTESVTKTFTSRNDRITLSQFGFIVIEVGNRGGNPQRSKWYHTFGYGNLRDYGLADKKAAIEQLSRRHPFIDIDRVGIYGHSGGGFMSTAAMLVYPDFFKVAVSSSGNHENNIYNRWWSEKHHGVKEVTDKDGNVKFEYNIEKNSELAKNLKGRLMLATGDIDNNVHPANTLRMADALIKANKRFDMVVLPGKRHGYADATNYFFWLRADYFCKHLIGDMSDSIDMVELNREREQVGDKGQVRRGPDEEEEEP
jgi:dipeptidyl-peptidase-4